MNDPHASSEAEVYNRRLGLVLFAIYLLVYGGFVALTAIDYQIMGTKLLGVNLAIVWGMALIIGALVIALIYMWMARPEAPAGG